MIKKMPPWASSAFITIIIILTAFLLGQLGATILRGKLMVPRKIILAREKNETTAREKSLNAYNSEILPILGQPAASSKKTKPAQSSDGDSAVKQPPPEDLMDWDNLLAGNSNQIRLNGTVIGADMAIAFFTVNGKDISLYIGQEVGDYIVDSITKNTATLRKGDNLHIIAMEFEETSLQQVASIPQPGNITIKKNPEPEINLDEIVSFQGDTAIVDRRKFNALLNPPSKLANDIKFIPHSKDGKPYGIRISYIKPDSFFTKIGMKSGDVLIKTNMKELQSVEDSFYAYQAFRNEEHLTLEVDREGEVVKIPLEFR